MAIKGERKKAYQREYMRGYMQRRRADVKTLLRPTVKTPAPDHPGDAYGEPVDFGA